MLPESESIGRLSDVARRALRRWVAPVVRRCFRPSIRGWEHLPEGPCLIVANHSAGVAVAELASLGTLFDAERPEARVAGFAHVIGFRFAAGRAVHAHLGTVPSTYEGAYAALDAGSALLVFPGGDYESLRPIHRVHEVDFNGRMGFLRIARHAQAPIVPLGIRGSHWTAPILFRGPVLAWLFVLPRLGGLKRWGVSLLGVVGAIVLLAAPLPLAARVALAWVWMGTPLSFAPVVPARLRFAFGPPLDPATLFAESELPAAPTEPPQDPAAPPTPRGSERAPDPSLERAYREVVSRIQGLVDELGSRV